MTLNDILSSADVVKEDGGAAVIRHDARSLPFPDESVDLIVTSPPYFALRSYRDGGEHMEGQIGDEASPGEFLDALDACMVEWRRVLKPSGSVWVNLGDKYMARQMGYGQTEGSWAKVHAHTGDTRSPGEVIHNERAASGAMIHVSGIRRKSLMGFPWRFALRQIDAGWILRAEVVWSKPNSLPEPVTDRVRKSHEQWFHFTKEPSYFAAIDEVREPHSGGSNRGRSDGGPPPGGKIARLVESGDHGGNYPATNPDLFNLRGRLPGSVWTISSEPMRVSNEVRDEFDLPDHFAAFPQEWSRRIILGWSPVGYCTECEEPRVPIVDIEHEKIGEMAGGRTSIDLTNPDGHGGEWDAAGYPVTRSSATIQGYGCECDEPDAPMAPAVVLDPFGGTGTVAGVARVLGRFGISNDLSQDYNRLACWRVWESGHFEKSVQRTHADRQGVLL